VKFSTKGYLNCVTWNSSDLSFPENTFVILLFIPAKAPSSFDKSISTKKVVKPNIVATRCKSLNLLKKIIKIPIVSKKAAREESVCDSKSPVQEVRKANKYVFFLLSMKKIKNNVERNPQRYPKLTNSITKDRHR
jgi:hypothetical protein